MNATLEKRILASHSADPTRQPNVIAKNLNGAASAADVRAVLAKHKLATGQPATKPLPVDGGVKLDGHRVVVAKPTVSPLRGLIRSLPHGRGFTVSELADLWGFSEPSIENAAKAMKCRRAVETSPDVWVYMIMEPTTAAKYGN